MRHIGPKLTVHHIGPKLTVRTPRPARETFHGPKLKLLTSHQAEGEQGNDPAEIREQTEESFSPSCEFMRSVIFSLCN